jgi:fimbrial isopeptide formation D2 family protein/LPXTG-motif cell wall-anchored protein
MKKMRKVLAVILSLAMILGMSITTFAADGATITVQNADGATLTYKQVIKPDQTTETGWAFTDDATANAYKTALKATTDQTAIWMLIAYADDSANVPSGISAATAAQINDALDGVTGLSDFTSGSTVTTAGVYAIKADEEGYAYSPMAAYVSFGTYDQTAGTPGALVDAVVNAKKTELQLTKTNSNGTDKVVEVGSVITYTLTTTVPYINDATTSVVFNITDTISGAKYVVDDSNKVSLNVSVNGTPEENARTATVTTTEDGKQTFTLDLSDIATDREKANQTLVITYDATVTGTKVENNAVPNDDGTHDFTTTTDKLYTGSLTLTKTGENNAALENAQFVVYKTVDSTNYYAITNDSYEVTGWTTDEAKATKVKTGTDGTVTVVGLDDSITYKFKEVEAPDGYSVNTEDATATWNDNTPADAKTGTASMTDTKLSALPSTGGIGTTIFTIGGCAIMIAAAALFFANRRKSAK